jgi:hypothetical protein
MFGIGPDLDLGIDIVFIHILGLVHICFVFPRILSVGLFFSEDYIP